ncbi:MAG: hypothetical protein AAGC95_01795 [Pseudomonadota bacterium]
MSTEDNTHDGPADTLRDGALKATIWENHGENGSYFTTTLARTYEDKNGKLRDTHSFGGTDLLRVAELARSAYGRSNELRRELNQSQDRNTSSRDDNDRHQRGDNDDAYDEGEPRRARQDNFRSRRQRGSRQNGRARSGNADRLPDRDL